MQWKKVNFYFVNFTMGICRLFPNARHLKKCWLILFAITLFSCAIYSSQLPPGFVEKRIATGFDPTRMAIAPDGRIFIAEKNGTIHIIRDDVLLDDPFLILEVDNYNERGLSGLVFHPDFEKNNHLFIYYTVPGASINRISRITANGDFAIPGSEKILVETDRLAGSIHNAGDMVFGEDGKLYIAVGDGSFGHLAQEKNSLLGKILRINDDGSIPEDNPFFNQNDGKFRAVWATGLRNPFTMAYQSGSRRLFITDVGSSKFEEVNSIIKGGNYGWNIGEGFIDGNDLPVNYHNPIHSYDHGIGCSVIGAAFYNPKNPTFPEAYVDKFYFADYCKGWIKRMDPESGDIEEVFATGINRPISIVVAENGDMYYLERNGIGGGSTEDNTSSSDGALWRISYQGTGLPFVSAAPDDLYLPIGENAHFRISANGDTPLHYQWYRNGMTIPDANTEMYVESSVTLQLDSSIYYCIVSNNFGTDTSQNALLRVTSNTRPIINISSPTHGATYQAGDTLFFSGWADDREVGLLSPFQFTWKIDFHHDEHTHPGLVPVTGIGNGNYIIPTTGEISTNVWYRVWLSAFDPDGLSGTDYVDVFPELGTIDIQSDPSGLLLNVDGKRVRTPFTTDGVLGVLRTIQAPDVIRENDMFLIFDEWQSETKNRILPFITRANNSFIALYDNIEVGDGTGLRGHYYNSLAHGFNGPITMSRLDNTIDFNWDSGSPNERINNDHFSIRWKGEILPLFDGEYIFYVTADDGIRLWVDKQLIIDQWIDQPPTEWTGKILLNNDRRYSIRMEYYENGGGAVAQLRWSHKRITNEIVPKTQLFPEREVELANHEWVELIQNPILSELNLCIKSDRGGFGYVRTYDEMGRQFGEKISFDHLPLLTEVQVPLPNLVPGIYFAEVRLNTDMRVLKFIKY